MFCGSRRDNTKICLRAIYLKSIFPRLSYPKNTRSDVKTKVDLLFTSYTQETLTNAKRIIAQHNPSPISIS